EPSAQGFPGRSDPGTQGHVPLPGSERDLHRAISDGAAAGSRALSRRASAQREPDTKETMCIACDLCALACPENLIVVSSARNEQTRRKELTNFTYDLSRCMFCGLCEDACPVDALELTQDFELASYTREGAIWDRVTLEKGPQPTQYRK